MYTVFGLSMLAVAGGLGVFLYALRRRLFAGMAHGFLVTLLLAVAGASLTTAWLLGVLTYQASERVLFEQTVAKLEHVGDVIEATINDGIAYTLERLQHLAGELAPDVAHGNLEPVRNAIRIVQVFTPRFLQINVYDHQGAVLVAQSRTEQSEPPNPIAVAFNLMDKPFADAYFSPVFQKYVVYLSTPLRDADATIIGVLSVRYDMQEYLARVVSATRFGASAYTALTTHEGRILAHPDAQRLNDDISGYPAVQQARLGETGWTLSRNTAGQKRLMVYRPMKSPATLDPKPWVLLASMDASEATAPIRSLRQPFVLVTVLLVAGWLVLAVQVAFSIRRPVAALLQMAEGVRDGDLTARSAIEGRDEVGRLAVTLNDMARGLQERDRIKEVFGRYVTTQVSDELLKGQITLGGVAKRVTILFSDVRNFTAMSEAMSPEQVVTFLNAYFSEMVEAVFEQNGVLDKFIGDGLLAIFGSLDEAPDHPRRAVLTALRMQARLAKLNGERGIVGQAPIAIGIGIHTDTVIVGNIGSYRRLEYTVIGDGVNTCARVESANKELGTTILITQTTWEAVQDDFECRPMPAAHLKGKLNTLQLYEVVNARAAASYAAA